MERASGVDQRDNSLRQADWQASQGDKSELELQTDWSGIRDRQAERQMREKAEKSRYALRRKEPRRQSDIHARQHLSFSHRLDTATPQATAKHMRPFCRHNELL